MTEDEFYALPEAQHTIWCVGTHDRDGECVLEAPLATDRDATTVRIQGVPTDTQYIEFSGALDTVAEIDAAIALLTQLRERFAAQEAREVELDALWKQVDR